MKKIVIPCLLILSFEAHAVAVSVATTAAIAANAAANNQRLQEQQQQLNQQRLEKINKSTDGLLSGVFVCKAHDPKTKGYYAYEYTKCDFWSDDEGYYSLNLSEIPSRFFPKHEVLNVFLNTHEGKFEFYYR